MAPPPPPPPRRPRREESRGLGDDVALALREFTAGFFAFLGFEVVVVLMVAPGFALLIVWTMIGLGLSDSAPDGRIATSWIVMLYVILAPYCFLYGAYVPAALANASLRADREPVSRWIFRPPGRGIATSALLCVLLVSLCVWVGVVGVSPAFHDTRYLVTDSGHLVMYHESPWTWTSVWHNTTLGVLFSVCAALWLASVTASLEEGLGPLRAVAAAARLAPRDVGTTMVLPVTLGILLGLGFTAVEWWVFVVLPAAVPISCLVVARAYRRLSSAPRRGVGSGPGRGEVPWTGPR